jgi:hypothetical protein
MPCHAEKAGKKNSAYHFYPFLLLLEFRRSRHITKKMRECRICLLIGMPIVWILTSMFSGMDCSFIRADLV